jgi:hypothetical protein
MTWLLSIYKDSILEEVVTVVTLAYGKQSLFPTMMTALTYAGLFIRCHPERSEAEPNAVEGPCVSG